MSLPAGGEIVDLGDAGPVDEARIGAEVGEIVFDEVEVGVFVAAQFFEAPEVHRAGAAIGTVNGVPFAEEQAGEVGAVLACDAGDECDVRHGCGAKRAERASFARALGPSFRRGPSAMVNPGTSCQWIRATRAFASTGLDPRGD